MRVRLSAAERVDARRGVAGAGARSKRRCAPEALQDPAVRWEQARGDREDRGVHRTAQDVEVEAVAASAVGHARVRWERTLRSRETLNLQR